MAVTCTSANLIELGKCFAALPEHQLEAIKTYLLALEAGGSTDPQTLIDDAVCFAKLPDHQLKAIQVYLLCQIANAAPPPAESDGLIWGPNPETVDDIAGVGDIMSTFTNALLPPSAYTEFSFGNPVTVVNGVNFGNDTVITSLSFRLLESVGTNMDISFSVVESLSMDVIETIGNDLNVGGCAALSSVSAPLLNTIINNLVATNASPLTILSLPSLAVLASIDITGSTIETLNLPSLNPYATISADSTLLNLNIASSADDAGGGFNVDVASMTGLVTLNISAMTMSGDLDLTASPDLESFVGTNWTPLDGTTIDFSGCSLDVTSVNLILRRCVVAGVTTCTIDLSGGTNAAPTGQGIVDAADLVTAGNTVNTN